MADMSTMVNELLQFSGSTLDGQIQIDDLANIPHDDSDIRNKMIESAKEVRSNLKEANIGSKDALNLWGATMQACAASLTNRMKFTVVMSARIMWFVKLDIRADECTVLISDSILIGKPGFTQKLIRFIKLADDNNDNEVQNKHQKTGDPDCGGHNIVSNLLMTSKSRPSNIPRPVSTDNSSSPIKTAESPTQIIQSADGSTKQIVSPGPVATEMGNAIKSIGTRSKSKRMIDEEQMMWQRAFTGLGNADMKKYLDQDQDGVIIPYLCQLEGAEVESLGVGRCGTVKKIRWNDGFAAMKEYVLQHEDDPRIPSDVYEHELKVFYRLKSLWGQYVPRLLFHNPWSCRPSIGLEVGQPMDYDFEKWVEADKENMRETIAKIEEKGFKQDDCRAANFVRLDNGSIAMIDFEAVVEISS